MESFCLQESRGLLLLAQEHRFLLAGDGKVLFTKVEQPDITFIAMKRHESPRASLREFDKKNGTRNIV